MKYSPAPFESQGQISVESNFPIDSLSGLCCAFFFAGLSIRTFRLEMPLQEAEPLNEILNFHSAKSGRRGFAPFSRPIFCTMIQEKTASVCGPGRELIVSSKKRGDGVRGWTKRRIYEAETIKGWDERSFDGRIQKKHRA